MIINIKLAAVCLMLVNSIGCLQNGFQDQGQRDVTLCIISGRAITLPWQHTIPEYNISDCYISYITKDKGLREEFLGYNYGKLQHGRLNMTFRQQGWEFINDQSPCLGGIKKNTSDRIDDGKYVMTLNLKNKSQVETEMIAVTLFNESEVTFTIQVNNHTDKLVVFDGPNITLDEYISKFGEEINFRIIWNNQLIIHNITMTHFVDNEKQFHLNCPELLCVLSVFATRYTDNLALIKIETTIQDYEYVYVEQKITLVQEMLEDKRDPRISKAAVAVICVILISVVLIVLLVIYKKTISSKCSSSKSQIRSAPVSSATPRGDDGEEDSDVVEDSEEVKKQSYKEIKLGKVEENETHDNPDGNSESDNLIKKDSPWSLQRKESLKSVKENGGEARNDEHQGDQPQKKQETTKGNQETQKSASPMIDGNADSPDGKQDYNPHRGKDVHYFKLKKM